MDSFAFRCFVCSLALLSSSAVLATGANGLQGSIAATDATCAIVNGNLFDNKGAVSVKAVQGAGKGSMLTDGSYYVKVTTPSGDVLGASTGTSAIVLSGKINGSSCVSLNSLLAGGSYADTTNNGGEYKVWISTTSNFTNSTSKTDNFKVRPVTPPPPPPVVGSVTIYKFYDANVNGCFDAGEDGPSWKVQLSELDPQNTTALYSNLPMGDYTAREFDPVGNSVTNAYSWIATNAYQNTACVFAGPDGGAPYLNKWQTTLTESAPDVSVYFGNVCIGPATGGRSKGYWTNKNGQADMTRIGMTYALNNLGLLVDAKGLTYLTFTNYKDFSKWLGNSTATNMSYMLSAQKAALKLAVLTGTLNYSDNVYAPGVPAEWGANPAGFITIGQLLAYTENQLSQNPYVRDGIPVRAQLEFLKNVIESIDVNRAELAQPSAAACGALAF